MIATKQPEQKSKRMRGRARAEVVKPAVIEGPSSAKSPTLSPGVKLSRVYKGRKIVVTCMEGGKFEYAGEFFKSLSAIANKVTGGHHSGVAWFGLRAKKVKS